MPWLQRGRNRAFYQSLRINGQVVHRYLGSGPEAEQAAVAIEERRQRRAAARAALATERQRHAEALTSFEQFWRLVDVLMHASLNERGYFQHNRGQWRRRRCR
jgi:hypothetical protein